MGAWGSGIFDSDAALDFVLEITAMSDLSRVRQALDDVEHAMDDYIDAGIAEQGLVAAEITAALSGAPGDLPEELVDWLTDKPAASSNMRAQAHRAVQAIRDDSELRELWDEAEAEDFEAWLQGIDDLLERLAV